MADSSTFSKKTWIPQDWARFRRALVWPLFRGVELSHSVLFDLDNQYQSRQFYNLRTAWVFLLGILVAVLVTLLEMVGPLGVSVWPALLIVAFVLYLIAIPAAYETEPNLNAD